MGGGGKDEEKLSSFLKLLMDSKLLFFGKMESICREFTQIVQVWQIILHDSISF